MSTFIGPDHNAIYIAPFGQARFNLGFKITPESIEDLIAKEILTLQGEMILKVKKPDYLGQSIQL